MHYWNLPGTCLREQELKFIRLGKTSRHYLKNKKNINEKMTEQARRAIIETREKGAFSWSSLPPLEELGFVVSKEEFPKDSLRLRH